MATGRQPKWVAITGDMDLCGNLLEVHGLPSKLSASMRTNISSVLIPEVSANRLTAANTSSLPAVLRAYVELDGVLQGFKHIMQLIQSALEGA
jgi:ATP-dependent Lon protease